MTLGGLSVDIFFVISGYLIMNSLKYSRSPQNYIWKRLLRLFPALILLLLLTLIWVVFIYTGDNILKEKSFWSYIPNNLSLFNLQYSINGVFDSNPYPKAINGSLWSLCYEFTMYLFIFLFFPFKNKKILPILVFCAFILSLYCLFFRPNFLSNIYFSLQLIPKNLYKLSTLFIAGSFLSFINLEKINISIIKILLCILILASIYFNIYNYSVFFLLPLLTILIGLSYSETLNFIPNKIGDISYGMYIYGFPVQQSLMHFFDLSPLFLMILSLPITAMFAYFSWITIEKRAMSFKNWVR